MIRSVTTYIFLNVSFEHNLCTPIEIINQSMLFSIGAYSIVCIIIKACAILISGLNGNEHFFFSKMDVFGFLYDVCTYICFFISQKITT